MKKSTFLFCLTFLITLNAYGYIDPGTGSYFFQLAIGALLGAGFLIKLYWKKLKEFLKKIVTKKARNHTGNGR